MPYRKKCTAGAVMLLGLIPTWAAAQSTTRSPATTRTALPLEAYTPSLSIATPAGVLRRQDVPKPVEVWVVDPRHLETRAPRATAAAAPVAAPASSMPECPMPVVRRDSTLLEPMPVAPGSATARVGGTLPGCINPQARRF